MFVLSCDPGLRSGFAEIMFGNNVLARRRRARWGGGCNPISCPTGEPQV